MEWQNWKVIMNWQLVRLGFPQTSYEIRKTAYITRFENMTQKKTKTMERIVTLAMMESL